LAGGFLTGKYQAGAQPARETRFGFLTGRTQSIYHKRYWQDVQFEAVDHLKKYFVQREKSLTQVAIAWVLAQPDITSAIVGATSAAQLRESVPAIEIKLDADEMKTCDDVWFDLPRLRDPSVAMR
jgi:aryl-alcohol dehydrogenase-like predicted oxidoreductase